MRTLQQWFDEYAVSHQNLTNKQIHLICVPTIFFSIVGLLQSINDTWLQQLVPFSAPIFVNWAGVVLVFALLFYIRLSLAMAVKIALFAAFCLTANYYIGLHLPLVFVSLGLFVAAWIGQFYGHKIEGKKPSFLNDLQFLLIGPAWIIHEFFERKISHKER
jgi:uncharacterized membrane protein YGL010W